MTDAAPEAAVPRRQMPAWMQMPGAPPQPNHREFGVRMAKLAAERRALIDQIKELQSTLRGNDGRDAVDQERSELRKRIGEIDELRKRQEELRVGKNDEIAKIRRQKHEINERLRALQNELGGFSDYKDIDEAIRFIMVKMETSGGGLRAERRTMRRLHQLEEAKSLLMQRQPLTEAIEEAEEREVLLQQEYREIHERIGALNKEYEEEYKNKQSKDKAVRATGAERAEVWRKCEQLRAKVTAINTDMDKQREEHARITAAWDAWCADARAKYTAKMEKEREARQQRFLATRNATKMDGKMERARQRMHSHELEMGACDTLIAYLLEKKAKTMREAEERAKRAAAATFDVSKTVPQGYVVLNEGKWSKTTSTKGRGKAAAQGPRGGATGGKPSTNATATTTATTAAKAPSSAEHATTSPGNGTSATQERATVLQFTEDKMRLFQLVHVDPPVSIATIDTCVAAIRDKLAAYKAQASSAALELSSDDDDEADAKSHADDSEADAAEQVPSTSVDAAAAQPEVCTTSDAADDATASQQPTA